MSLGRDACPCNNLERFETEITNLHASAILAVLNDGVVQLQFMLGWRNDIISAKAGVVKLAYDPQIPVVVRLVNQRRPGKNTLQAQFVAENPDDTATGCDRRILKQPPAQTEKAKDLVFL